MSAVVDFLVRADHRGLERSKGESPETGQDIADALTRFASAARTGGKEYALARQSLLVHALGAPSSAAALADGRQRLITWGAEALHSTGATRPEAKSALIVGLVDGMISASLFMGIAVEESALRSAINAIITDP
ncbi:hypothetical protein [Pseudarthrobacter sp. N5]|uniref:hypothetical protein n=1 Tax=Pseudarthrobacter sp. N5 TaxID=3418416 RepID=UPI003CE7B10D